jgi:hypothetical protein
VNRKTGLNPTKMGSNVIYRGFHDKCRHWCRGVWISTGKRLGFTTEFQADVPLRHVQLKI